MKELIGIGCSMLILLACSKNDASNTTGSTNASKLSAFSVSVLERTSITAVIQWDSSINKTNNEQVKYKVLLDNVVVDTGLSRTIDTLFKLVNNKIYTGKVIAYIMTDSIAAEFSLSTYEGYFYAATRSNSYGATSRLGYFNGYPTPLLQVQPSIWRLEAGVLLEPTLSNDTLFIVSDNHVKAINALTGTLLWQNSSTYSFNTPVTYNEGKLYACIAGALVCFNSSTGQQLWSYRSSFSYINLVSIPVVDDNKVFVASRSSSGEIACVDAQSGAKIWSYPISSPTCSRPLAISGVVVFIIALEGRVLAINQRTGSPIWNRKDFGSTGSDQFNPVYSDGNVIVHTNGKLSALDLQTGAEKWKYDYGMTKSSCVAGNGRIYFCQDSIDGYDRNSYYRNLLCLKSKDGSILWRQNSQASGHEYSRLAFGKDKIYALEEYVFNPDFGRRIVAFNAINGNRDVFFSGSNPVQLNRYEHVYDYCVKRDRMVYYPATHGNYR